MTRNEFINTISSIIRAENLKRGNQLFNSVVIAQAILESNYGQSEIMMKANAVFGIKATNTWKGKKYNAKTGEFYNNNYVTINACFRAYDSLEESVKDYFDLMDLSRYEKAKNQKSPRDCIKAIIDGGYATSPTYVESIMKIIMQNNLVKYDTISNIDIPFKIGQNYTLQENMFVRTGAGQFYSIKAWQELTEDGKKHAVYQKYGANAVLKKGTIVTCKGIIKENGNIWMEIPSGFVAGIHNGERFIK